MPFLHRFSPSILKVKIMSNSVFQFLLLLVSLTVQQSGAAPRLAMPKCSETCGNVTIPFPFGVGDGCFLDDWYEIVCQQNNMVPVLNKVGLRVLNISLPNMESGQQGMLKVSLPVIYSDLSCQGNRIDKPVSLQGSNFVFSRKWNVFTSVGCDTMATVTSTESNGIASVSASCRSRCAGTNNNVSRYSSCSGRDGCCQAKLPSNLQVFNVEIEEGGNQGCKYAFLVETSWFLKLSVTDLYDLRLNDTMVPVVLQWAIQMNNKSLQELYQISKYSSVFTCSTGDPDVECFCKSGYGGNPYFFEGCQGNITHAITHCF